MEPLVANEKAISMNPAIDNIQSSGSSMSEETGTNNSIFTHNRTANSASIKNNEKKAERPNGQYYFSLFEVDSGSDDSLCGTSPTLDIPLLGNQQRRSYGLLPNKIFDCVRRKFVKVLDRYNSDHEQIEDSIFQASSYTLLQESSHYSELPRPPRYTKKHTRKSSFLTILQMVFFFFLLETLFVLRFHSGIVEYFQEKHTPENWSSLYYYTSHSYSNYENLIVLLLIGSIFFLVLYKCWTRWITTRSTQIGNNNVVKMSLGIFLFITSAVIVHF